MLIYKRFLYFKFACTGTIVQAKMEGFVCKQNLFTFKSKNRRVYEDCNWKKRIRGKG